MSRHYIRRRRRRGQPGAGTHRGANRARAPARRGQRGREVLLSDPGSATPRSGDKVLQVGCSVHDEEFEPSALADLRGANGLQFAKPGSAPRSSRMDRAGYVGDDRHRPFGQAEFNLATDAGRGRVRSRRSPRSSRLLAERPDQRPRRAASRASLGPRTTPAARASIMSVDRPRPKSVNCAARASFHERGPRQGDRHGPARHCAKSRAVSR